MDKETGKHLEHIEMDLIDIKRHEAPLRRYFLQFIILVFIAGGAWITLDNVEAMAEDNRDKIELQEKRDDDVDKKLERITVTQEHIKEELDDQGEILDEILKELREN